MKPHGARKHSKYSASGAERWFNCPGSVALSEGLPDKDPVWSIEGTRAHEILEELLKVAIQNDIVKIGCPKFPSSVPLEMVRHGTNAANFILSLGSQYKNSEILVETRIRLEFIHSEMFGTFDGAVVDHFGTLHVFDYKYGAGHAVSPTDNLQMLFYGIGLAAKYDWNFKRVRLWIIQPRIRGYDGPVFWELSLNDLYAWVAKFKDAVERVERNPKKYVEGSWCHWCKAKSICPIKQQGRLDKAMSVFSKTPLK